MYLFSFFFISLTAKKLGVTSMPSTQVKIMTCMVELASPCFYIPTFFLMYI